MSFKTSHFSVFDNFTISRVCQKRYSVHIRGWKGTFFRRRSFSIISSRLADLITSRSDEVFDHSDEFVHLFRQINGVSQLRQVHAKIIATGSSQSGFLPSKIVSMYSDFRLISEANRVFETSIHACSSNVILWNSILRDNVSHGRYGDALRLYARMKRLGVIADGYTFPLVIRACPVMGNYNLCRSVHAHVLQMGLQNHLHSVNELLVCYGKLGRMDAAVKLFDKMPVRSHISWNTMVSGFSLNHDCNAAHRVFRRMEMEGLEPNVVTWTALLSSYAKCGLDKEVLELFGSMRNRGIDSNAESLAVVLSSCAGLDAYDEGREIHAYAIKAGFENYMIVKNSLICAYGKHGDVEGSRNLFLEMKMKSIVTWNSLITAFAESGYCDEALEIFSELERSEDNMVVRPNVVSWSAVISGLALKGRGEEALQFFRKMQEAIVSANPVTISSLLSICADLAALPLGEEIHACIIRGLMDHSVMINNGLINMYVKCGRFREGRLIFERMGTRDLISWNSLTAGYGIHGYGVRSLETFNEMIKEGLKPDEITFVALLSSCGHAGLVSEGREIFNKMSIEFGIKPQIQHYACMVDLLGRAGLIEEANAIVKNMPMKPNACVLGALLNAARVHKNADVAEETAAHIFSLSSDSAGSYMLLSNIYSAARRWSDSAKVRLSAKTSGLKKTTGQSWIEIKKRVYVFSAGSSENDLREVYEILEELGRRLEIEGYVADKSFVLQNVDEDEKKQILKGHSEKLAIAFGYAKLPPSLPIRVFKNLRFCGDCHSWTKFFSKVTGREVIVRDARRFHHFVDGLCSCKDYW